MSILKSSNTIEKSDAQRIVGVVLPEKVFTYFSLFVTAKGCTKATVIRELMNKWWNNKTIDEPENTLLEVLLRKIQAGWDSMKLKVPEKSIDEFRLELEQELRKKGLRKAHVQKILNKIKE